MVVRVELGFVDDITFSEAFDVRVLVADEVFAIDYDAAVVNVAEAATVVNFRLTYSLSLGGNCL